MSIPTKLYLSTKIYPLHITLKSVTFAINRIYHEEHKHPPYSIAGHHHNAGHRLPHPQAAYQLQHNQHDSMQRLDRQRRPTPDVPAPPYHPDNCTSDANTCVTPDTYARCPRTGSGPHHPTPGTGRRHHHHPRG